MNTERGAAQGGRIGAGRYAASRAAAGGSGLAALCGRLLLAGSGILVGRGMAVRRGMAAGGGCGMGMARLRRMAGSGEAAAIPLYLGAFEQP